MNKGLERLFAEKNKGKREMSDETYLFNLSDRLKYIPYGADQYDMDRLREMANKLKEDRELKEKGLVRATEIFGPNITTKTVFEKWRKEGIKKKAAFMIVVCDTFDHSDYPVYVMPGEDLQKAQKKYDGNNMQRIMETVDLRPVDPITGMPKN